MQETTDEPAVITGKGSISYPVGITAEEAQRLAKQADQERNQ